MNLLLVWKYTYIWKTDNFIYLDDNCEHVDAVWDHVPGYYIENQMQEPG